MMEAEESAVEATVQFARDTDDPEAALRVFLQVLGEIRSKAQLERGCRYVGLAAEVGRRVALDLVGQALVLGHGLAALVGRVMEAFDEDTWRDFLADEREDRGEPRWPDDPDTVRAEFTADMMAGLDDDAGDPVCPDHGPLEGGYCPACERDDLVIDMMRERRAFGD